MIGLVFIIWIVIGLAPLVVCAARSGPEREVPRSSWVKAAVAAAVITGPAVFLIWFLGFFGELLWFESVGYAARFWKVFWTQVGLFLAASAGAVILLAVVGWFASRAVRQAGRAGAGKTAAPLVVALAALILGSMAASQWETVLLFRNGVQSGTADPIFSNDISFYLFRLPFYSFLVTMGFGAVVASIVLTVAMATRTKKVRGLLREGRLDDNRQGQRGRSEGSLQPFAPILMSLAALLLLLLAANHYLARFRLMYSTLGVVAGAGWTDVHVRIPMYGAAVAIDFVAAAALAAMALAPAAFGRRTSAGCGIGLGLAYGLVLLLILAVAPWLAQILIVRPNELAKEAPYVRHNIDYTRRAFALTDDRILEKVFPVSDELSQAKLEANPNTLSNVRLWDWRALLSTLQQLQEIRYYYEFRDVDIDRYTLNGDYRQIMLAVRELAKEELREKADTWVNRHIKYTHGFGLTLNPVSEFQPNGEPVLLAKDIPPTSTVNRVEVSQPRIYYGDLTDDHVYVKTKEDEFDYPSGDRNIETTYDGKGGVRIGAGFFRRVVFAWKFDGNRLLFTGYLTPESRILFHRQTRERLLTLAPFLTFDEDPYMVIDGEGRLKWICDAYTSSDYYPYSEPCRGAVGSLRGENYLRNSVKAVVDAYDGTVQFYIFEEDDVVIRTYAAIFPGMFRPRDEMPGDLVAHVRYPGDFFQAQAEMFATYHMDDVTVFYNREDMWSIANEKYRGNVQRVMPYYVILRLPEETREEFALILPFTPINKDVMMGWMAGRCDGEHYGKLVVYKFPKGRLTLGPMQVESKIDQDEQMSRDLTLWDQRGSQVIRGNLLVIPVEDTILYVEPIYLQAETAKIPQLRKVVTAHWQTVVWANSFADSLATLLAAKRGEAPPTRKEGVEGAVSIEELVKRADEHLRNWQRLTGEGKYGQAGQELQNLQKTLDLLLENTRK